MQKWEYLSIDLSENNVISVQGNQHTTKDNDMEIVYAQTVIDYLTEKGQEGWEAIGVYPSSGDGKAWRLLMKKPKQ